MAGAGPPEPPSVPGDEGRRRIAHLPRALVLLRPRRQPAPGPLRRGPHSPERGDLERWDVGHVEAEEARDLA